MNLILWINSKLSCFILLCICLVRLNPPYNLSVVWFEQNSTLVLHWKKSTNISNKCMVYMVHQETDTIQVKLLKRDILVTISIFPPMSYLSVSLAHSTLMWQNHHTVCRLRHRINNMLSESGALFLITVVLHTSGVTGAFGWSGAMEEQIQMVRI